MNIVLIADRVSDHKNSHIHSTSLEKLEDSYFNLLYDTLVKLYSNVYEYESPSSFIDNINKHRDDIIFPLWSGENSRNRRALIPSICEAYNLCYVGADSYVNIVCQDKALSKQICKKNNILVPDFRLVDDHSQVDIIYDLDLPLVVKPNFEGGSIGITQRNLVYSYEDAKSITTELINIFKQPILIEEFINGAETSFVCQGNLNEVKFLESIEIELKHDHLNDTIYSLEIKKQKNEEIIQSLTTSNINKNIIENIKNLFLSLGKVDILRVDGRLRNGKFYCIEITPDISLSQSATFYKAFEYKGFSYDKMIDCIIKDVYQLYLNQNANKIKKISGNQT